MPFSVVGRRQISKEATSPEKWGGGGGGGGGRMHMSAVSVIAKGDLVEILP